MGYVLTNRSNNQQINVTDKQLANIAVELHGAGTSDKATAAAMQWQSKVIASSEPVVFEMCGTKLSIEKEGTKATGDME